jgi:DNA-binding protein HU-alpha
LCIGGYRAKISPKRGGLGQKRLRFLAGPKIENTKKTMRQTKMTDMQEAKTVSESPDMGLESPAQATSEATPKLIGKTTGKTTGKTAVKTAVKTGPKTGAKATAKSAHESRAKPPATGAAKPAAGSEPKPGLASPSAKRPLAGKTLSPRLAAIAPTPPSPAPCEPAPSEPAPSEPALDPAQSEMRKEQLLDAVAARSGVKRKDVKPVVEAMLEVLGEALGDARELNLKPLGKLKVARIKRVANGRVIQLRLRQSDMVMKELQTAAQPAD